MDSCLIVKHMHYLYFHSFCRNFLIHFETRSPKLSHPQHPLWFSQQTSSSTLSLSSSADQKGKLRSCSVQPRFNFPDNLFFFFFLTPWCLFQLSTDLSIDNELIGLGNISRDESIRNWIWHPSHLHLPSRPTSHLSCSPNHQAYMSVIIQRISNLTTSPTNGSRFKRWGEFFPSCVDYFSPRSPERCFQQSMDLQRSRSPPWSADQPAMPAPLEDAGLGSTTPTTVADLGVLLHLLLHLGPSITSPPGNSLEKWFHLSLNFTQSYFSPRPVLWSRVLVVGLSPAFLTHTDSTIKSLLSNTQYI